MNPYQPLLNQALIHYNAAVLRGDLAAAEKHRKIYAVLFPLAFAGLMQNSLTENSL